MTVREEILDQAKQLVTEDRNADYGDPAENFADIASLWTAYKGTVFLAHDVAAMMVLVKVARLATSPQKLDNWMDMVGYAALGGEVRPPEE